MKHIAKRTGVVMACGGFHDNSEMVESYLGIASEYEFFGSPYNTGDGVYMAQEAGAKPWHMNNYMLGFGFLMPKTSQTMITLAMEPEHGAVIAVGLDGTRFINEDWSTNSRHGHVHMSGS